MVQQWIDDAKAKRMEAMYLDKDGDKLARLYEGRQLALAAQVKASMDMDAMMMMERMLKRTPTGTIF